MIDTLEVLLGLLVAVAALALLARKLLVPFPILLVVGGLLLGLVPGLPTIRLNPELVFLVLLPPLLYPAALFTPWRDFSRKSATHLAPGPSGLVLFTTAAVGFLAHYFIKDLPLAAGFVLGSDHFLRLTLCGGNGDYGTLARAPSNRDHPERGEPGQ